MDIFFILLFAVFATVDCGPDSLPPLSDEFIDYINSVQNLWTAGRNFHPDTSLEYLKNLQGAIKSDSHILPEKLRDIEDEDLPENFDSREKWPHCKSLNEIRDQGKCGSCWAIAAAATMTDRLCIYSNGTQEFHFSTIDLTTCCDYCGNACNGGDPASAWLYYNTTGIVSGGNYNSSTGCRPYPYRNCNHHQAADDGYPDCNKVIEKYVTCEKTCVSKDIDYKHDLRKGSDVFMINGEQQMKLEIYNYGPIEAAFYVYEDFLSYKKGVYKHTAGGYLAPHAVKILGWGVENNAKYWLAANSWNEHWGDKGFFKFLRGENHCSIETHSVAGAPLLTAFHTPMEV